MKFSNIVKLLVSIMICELAGAIGYIFTVLEISGWYKNLNKPFFNPPNWIFGPVWVFLFLLMGISLYSVWSKKWVVKNKIGKVEKRSLNPLSEKLLSGSWKKFNIISIFYFQLILNISWVIIFFMLHLPDVAFFDILMLWFAILFTIINFYRVSKISSYLLVPYILWVSFAAVLNYFIWILN